MNIINLSMIYLLLSGSMDRTKSSVSISMGMIMDMANRMNACLRSKAICSGLSLVRSRSLGLYVRSKI